MVGLPQTAIIKAFFTVFTFSFLSIYLYVIWIIRLIKRKTQNRLGSIQLVKKDSSLHQNK